MSPAQVMLGGVVSAMVMCCTQVLMLPQVSVAFQVRSMPGWPVQLAAVPASVKVIVTVWPQLSVAVALPVLAGAVESPQAITLSAGQVMTGGVLSAKVMCCTQVLMLPLALLAALPLSMPGWPVQLAAVPESVKVMVTVWPQLSVAVALAVLAEAVELPHASPLSAGQMMTGGVLSAKLMCCTQVLMLPQASVAFQVRSMPGWPVQLAGVPASVKVMVTVWPQLSVRSEERRVGEAGELPRASTLSAGQVRTGGVVSAKVMCCTQVLMLPQASVAFQARSMPGWPVQLAAVPASVKVMVTVWPQLSVRSEERRVGEAGELPRASTLSAGQVRTG